ncbi:MAG: hypothetical protein LBI72_06750 [Flavobacteriaceae bacterium]|jgi:hypothetical protein|nr:hypothetical protein [Flavobacteriaceae bacterium]
MEKADKNTVQQRLGQIGTLLINGEKRENIVLYSSEKWSIGERQVDKYIARAKGLIEKSIKKSIEYDYAKAIRRYEDLYSKAIEEKDYRLAVSINKEITTLQGLNKLQVEHSGNVEFICNIPD